MLLDLTCLVLGVFSGAEFISEVLRVDYITAALGAFFLLLVFR